jgi:hypothetical protein
MSSGRRTLLAVVLVVSVALAGCSGVGGGGDGAEPAGIEADDAPGDKDGATATGSTATADQTADSGGSSPVAVRRAVVRTGHVTLGVDRYGAARADLTGAARSLGGFASDSSQTVHRRGNRTWTTGTVTYRVPSENFSAFVARVKGTGTVRSSETDSTEVSDRLVDLKARLASLRAQRQRLRGLYSNASDTEDVLAVEDRLSSVQAEIERLEATQRSLQRRVALSTVTVELREPRSEPDPETGTGPPPLAERSPVTAFLASIGGAVTAAKALVVLGAYLAPYLLVFGLPIGAVLALAYRRRD